MSSVGCDVTKFTDRHGRQWEITITVGTLGRLKAVGINLLDPALAEDIELFGRLLWVLCESQAVAAGLTEEQFADVCDGPTLAGATDAIDEEYMLFRLRRPALAAAAKGEILRLREAMDAAGVASMASLLKTLNGTAGNSPEPSESIPAR